MSHLFLFLEIFSREGGIQSYVRDVLRAYLALPGSGEAEVYLLRDGEDRLNPFTGRGLTFHYLKSRSPWVGRGRLAIALGERLLRRRPARVFCGHINLAPLVHLFCQPLGVPYTILTYGKEVWDPLPTARKRALRAADEIWTISRYSRDLMSAANDIAPDRVKILPCVVDGDRFTPGPKDLTLIEKYGMSGSRVLLTVARLWSGDIYKGVDVTIRALPKILLRHPDVKYLVVGRGDDRPRLEELTRELGVSERVVFAGFVPTEELVEHYRLADAYVMPSREGFGIVYLEAMACGVPVVSGDEDGSADPLQDGFVGWRVPYRDADAVALAVGEILGGAERRCRGDWLRERTLEKFGPGALEERLHELLVPDLGGVTDPRG